MHARAAAPDAFLEDHAVIVCSDHSQSLVEDEIDLFRAFDGFDVLPASGVRERRRRREIAVCPSSRAAHVYVLDRDRRAALVPRIARTLLALEGVDVVMHLTDHPDGEAAVRSRRGELRFAPRGDLTDLRGDALERRRRPRRARPRDERRPRRPPSATRTRSAASGRRCAAARPGEVLASAEPGWEFLDWGRSHHVGGGSHGSLHADDSYGSLLWCGTGPDDRRRARAVDAARRRADGARRTSGCPG